VPGLLLWRPEPFFVQGCVGNATIADPDGPMIQSGKFNGGIDMRALIVCAIVITAAVGLSGCFHHAQTVTQQPLKLG
jgi:hypothetical protein